MKRLNTAVQKHMVIIPKGMTKGSYFGQCTCGLVTCDAVPCEHMSAIVVSSCIGVLNRHNFMEKGPVAGAISLGGDSTMLCKHEGNQGQLQGR